MMLSKADIIKVLNNHPDIGEYDKISSISCEPESPFVVVNGVTYPEEFGGKGIKFNVVINRVELPNIIEKEKPGINEANLKVDGSTHTIT